MTTETADTRTPAEIEADNLEHFMERGPGLSYGYGTWIEAKDTKRGKVLVAGLGGMGVGRMWFDEQEHHRASPGYAEAAERDSDPPEQVLVRYWFTDEGHQGVDIQRTGGHWPVLKEHVSGVRLTLRAFNYLVATRWAAMTPAERQQALEEPVTTVEG